mmetsp:Transcript_4854/g.11791  ORF Transcript_4854/g.11791 Transcript_4854/m.11791 type:complete len:253 (+) Transcript_4854:1281-2039(+)
MSSRSPRDFSAEFSRLWAACPAVIPRTAWMAFLGDTQSQRPSDAMTSRPPEDGRVTWRISGSAVTVSPAQASPMVRDIARPPGQTRRGPTPFPPSTVDCATSEPAATTRARSSALSSRRWLPDTWRTSAPVSRNASESPTLATRSSQPTATATVAVVPDSGLLALNSASQAAKASASARGRRATRRSCASHRARSSAETCSRASSETSAGSGPSARPAPARRRALVMCLGMFLAEEVAAALPPCPSNTPKAA